MSQPMIENLHEVLRKCCHLAEYSILALLLWRAFSQSPGNWRLWSQLKVRRVILIAMLYASTDEFHQAFVPTRTSRVTDVLIDTAGASLGLLALWLLQRCWKTPAALSR